MILIIGYKVLSVDDGYEYEAPKIEYSEEERQHILKKEITAPIILWWTPFTGEPGRYRTCGTVQCFFTINRLYKDHPKTKVLLFYGTDMKVNDLPLPRHPHEEWGLLHEESPKNNFLFSHREMMLVFNHTCTFRRESDYPITTQYLESLEWLESTKYMVTTSKKNEYLSELAPLIYTHSDCDVPSDRDNLVRRIMEHMRVDSYGLCVHNKDLPKHLVDPIQGMEHEDFYQLNAKYKFSFSFENAICNDYITEKLWRPLMLGSVPVVMGSPRVRDYLPDNHSAIIVDDFKSVEELVNFLKFLNENDEEYEKYLQWKRTGITNKVLLDIMKNRDFGIKDTWKSGQQNFIEGFECFVCKRIHENTQRLENEEETLHFQADENHYGCPAPQKFDKFGNKVPHTYWHYEWYQKLHQAKAMKYFVDNNLSYSQEKFQEKIKEFHSDGSYF
ncbi:hypothetical protein CHS0354_019226 [Potamilus streckersoni]|uniref:Fucosyltransferase n=1 Tax=Potamilus streckersoni TaxID=2493646 RepID=A0AAE0T0C0_9BIVA|nr:hypothetical protein CHS0354_019226 [Potamilus streckersoni]